jgi:hypothetical protein
MSAHAAAPSGTSAPHAPGGTSRTGDGGACGPGGGGASGACAPPEDDGRRPNQRRCSGGEAIFRGTRFGRADVATCLPARKNVCARAAALLSQRGCIMCDFAQYDLHDVVWRARARGRRVAPQAAAARLRLCAQRGGAAAGEPGRTRGSAAHALLLARVTYDAVARMRAGPAPPT